MAKESNWKERLNIVYSTDPDFKYETESSEPEVPCPAPREQRLRLRMEKNGRGGKTVTVISGFRGPDTALAELAKKLKTSCGTGGAAKDGEIIIQGDFKERLLTKLKELGYSQSK